MSLTIGRVGLDVPIGHPASWTETVSLDGGRRVNIRGWFQANTFAEANALRSEMLEQQGHLVACTYTLDPTFDAFCYLSDVRIESVEVTYQRRIFRFEIELIRIGSDSRTELQSLLTGAGITNAHALSGELWHAVPGNAKAYNAGTTAPIEHSRTVGDGTVAVFLGIDPDQDPTWSIEPTNYYQAAVQVSTEGRLRAGQDVISDPADWEMHNQHIRVRPETYQGTSNGRIDIAFNSGSGWSTNIAFKILHADTTAIPKWHYVSILRNDPEMSTIRLVRDAETAPPSAHRHVLDITMRRGAPFVSCYYTFTGPVATHSVARDVTDAATAGTGHIRDTGTIDGHRWLLGSPSAYTADTTNGKIVLTATSRTLPFFLGAAVGDAASGSNDGPTDITDQYIGWISETVRAVRR